MAFFAACAKSESGNIGNSSFAKLEMAESPAAASTYDYQLYGLRVRSRMRLSLDEVPGDEAADVELLPGDPDCFRDALSQIALGSDWIHEHALSGGWSYIRYDDMFEFLVSPSGDRILYRMLADVTLECFQAYALGRVFSFALVKMGYEPLHASAVVVNGKAVAFLGASTFGKSSLAACFVAAGYPLLSDDVLRLEERNGGYVAFPGPPKLKLLPRIARIYLGDVSTGVPLNHLPKTTKLVFQLPPERHFPAAAPLAAIYAVVESRKVYRKQRITISPLPALEALVKALSYTHNHKLTGPDRLRRQLDAAQQLTAGIPMRSLAYPRVLSSLGDVREAVLADLKQYVN